MKSSNSLKSFAALKSAFTKNPNMYGQEGVDHILLSHNSKSDVGRWLAPSFAKKVTVSGLGEFASVRNFWVWLTTADHPDEIRSVSPKDLDKWLKNTSVKKGPAIPHFMELVEYAKYLQLCQHKPKLANEGKPLLLYSEDRSGMRITLKYGGWYIPAVESAMAAYLSGGEGYSTNVNGKAFDVEEYVNTKLIAELFPRKQPLVAEDGVSEESPSEEEVNQ